MLGSRPARDGLPPGPIDRRTEAPGPGRFVAAVVLSGCFAVLVLGQGETGTVLVYAAIIGSLMVSYARARAEGLGLDCKVGLATRVERVLVMSAGLILGHATLALWIVAVFANLTALQRIMHVRRTTAR